MGALKILVVEDEDASRIGLARIVTLLGHECQTARDGIEALELHQRHSADIILSDWRMPRMDGVQLCREVRKADGNDRYTYFVFLTAFDDKTHYLRGMAVGADDYQSKPVDIDALQARLVSAARVIGRYRKLSENNTELRRDSQSSFTLARIDPLTGVANRLRMAEDLAALLANAKRYGHHFSAAICDVDHFKNYNDSFGHLAGDDVLRKVAQTIRDTIRQNDSLYRYGGEEFLVVLPEQDTADAAGALDRVRREIERLAIPTVPEGSVLTISAGVAELSEAPEETVDSWLARADQALYRAKASGRNRVETDSSP